MTRRYPEIDKHIGHRLRRLRLQRDISLDALASMLGVSYQQVQKYETGENRIAAATLHAIATEFGIPISWFFEESGQTS